MKKNSDRPVRNVDVSYDNLRKVIIGNGDDDVIICLLDYASFKKYDKKGQ